ncbi:unnamed protein product [Microthlaspi erraticum]|uniref:Uncharacterized protein n=1 Tax=Microthlaspi erraticum TaxID=1685480 RepID=A0A6D2KUU1_9BRAS|nr:unnamed protein product [Microthlaspi erraticum]
MKWYIQGLVFGYLSAPQRTGRLGRGLEMGDGHQEHSMQLGCLLGSLDRACGCPPIPVIGVVKASATGSMMFLVAAPPTRSACIPVGVRCSPVGLPHGGMTPSRFAASFPDIYLDLECF